MTTIKMRRGLSAEWTSMNPVLAEGEVGVELDTTKFKIGDGASFWSMLQYFSPSDGSDGGVAGSIVAPEEPDPLLYPEGTIWTDSDSNVPPFDTTTLGHVIQDEGTVLADRVGLNFVGAGVTVSDDTANDRTIVTIPGAVSDTTILSGTATPTGAVGIVGDYYLDTDDRVLYGPKSSAAYGTAYSAYTSQIPSTVQAASNMTLGLDVMFAVAGRVTGLRYYRDASDTNVTTATMRLWTTAGVSLGVASFVGESTGSGWRTAYFSTPVDVAAGTTLCVSQDCVNRKSSVYTGSGSVTNGNLSTVVQNRWTPTSGVFPSGPGSGQNWIDVVFEEAPVAPWPVALKSVPPGGTTSQVLAKTSATDYATAWATAGATGTTYAADIGAVTANTPVTVTHNLGTMDVLVQVIEKNTAGVGASVGQLVFPTIIAATTNTITLTFAESKAANLYRVIVRS